MRIRNSPSLNGLHDVFRMLGVPRPLFSKLRELDQDEPESSVYQHRDVIQLPVLDALVRVQSSDDGYRTAGDRSNDGDDTGHSTGHGINCH